MACIICFLEDDYQERLRNISQSKGERFEDSLKEYKENFFGEFKYLKGIRQCPEHNNLNYNTIVWATRLHQTIARINDKERFFESVRNIYIKWISGKTVNAINSLKRLMSSKSLFSKRSNIDSRVFFRGRKSQSFLKKEDLYHIPFDKRYLVPNQRYSLTGQPIFYFGLSVLSVLAELRVSVNSFDDVYFSSFVIPDDSFQIFDFTNNFQSEIKNAEILIDLGDDIDYHDTQFNNVLNHTREFYKYLLLNIASFKRGIEGSNFIEEYVIPQMITEIARKKNYNGILFTSTRINKKIAYSTNVFEVNRYKENLALFTKYQAKEKFDLNLINKFLIGNPLKTKDYQEIDFSEIEKLGKQIIRLNNKKRKFTSLKQISELTAISYKTLFENIKVKDESGNDIDYFDHQIGKLHNYILYTELLKLRNQLLK